MEDAVRFVAAAIANATGLEDQSRLNEVAAVVLSEAMMISTSEVASMTAAMTAVEAADLAASESASVVSGPRGN